MEETEQIAKICTELLRLSTISIRKEKEDLLRQNDGPILRFFLETLFNPYLTYGVKKIGTEVTREVPPRLEKLQDVRNQLATRAVTGHAAIKLLETTVNCSDPDLRKVLSGIFVRDLRLGIDVSTVNRVFPNAIPTFDIKFCNVLQGNIEIKDKKKSYDVSLVDFEKQLQTGRWIGEPKLDGERCVGFVDAKASTTFYSRTGLARTTLDHIVEELKQLSLHNVNLDGEFFAGSWDESISFAHSSKNASEVDKSKAKYYIFDCVSKADWDAKSTPNLEERKATLKKLIKGKDLKYLVALEGKPIRSLAEAREFFNECLEQGFEGVVFKNLDTGYGFDRNNDWLKWKPFYSIDLPITGYYVGISGKNIGRLGGFLVNFNGVEVGIGGGYTEKEPDAKHPDIVNERQLFWDKREEMIGKVIEIKHYGVTKDGSLRHPQYLRIREDK